MRLYVYITAFLFVVGAILTGSHARSQSTTAAGDASLRAHADSLVQEYIIVDGHIDAPHRVHTSSGQIDLSTASPGGEFDYVRGTAGGLNAPFMSIYVPVEL